MYAFFQQLLTFIRDGELQIFLIAFTLGALIWLLRLAFLAMHKDEQDEFKGKFSVLMPVYHEEPELFERSLKSIKAAKPTELIVTFDGESKHNKELAKVAEKYATKVHFMKKRVGKRGQFKKALKLLSKKVDVILTTDSDSVWTESTLNILKPFKDEKIGGVVGRQVVYDRESNLTRRFADWLEDLRFKYVMPMQSRFGNVLVMPGRTLAVRHDVFKKIINDVESEKYFGRQMYSGDDGALTMEVLKAGFKTVYQSDSVTETNSPDSMKKIAKQYLRWYRNGYRRFFMRLRQYAKINPLVTLAWFMHLFGGLLFAGIALAFGAKLAFGLYEVLPVRDIFGTDYSVFLTVLIFILSSLLVRAIRHIPHFYSYPSDIIFLPLFALFTILILAPVKLFAMVSFFESSWMTRTAKDDPAKEKTGNSRAAAGLIGAAFILVLVPTVFSFDIGRLNIPTEVLVAGNGPEYYLARERTTALASQTQSSFSEDDIRILDGLNEGDDVAIDRVAYQFASDCVAQSARSNEVIPDPLGLYESCAQADYSVQIAALEQEQQVAGATTEIESEGVITDEAAVDVAGSSAQQSTSSALSLNATVTDGDSQTSIVRSFIASNTEFDSLNAAQKLYLETVLVDELGRQDLIFAGQEFVIKSELVTSYLEKATSLSAAQQKAWQTYL